MTYTERLSQEYDNRAPSFVTPTSDPVLTRKPKRSEWTNDEKRKVRREYPTRPLHELSADMNRTPFAIRCMAKQLCVQKKFLRDNVEFLDGVLAEYASATADEIAARRGVKVVTVRKWIALARAR